MFFSVVGTHRLLHFIINQTYDIKDNLSHWSGNNKVVICFLYAWCTYTCINRLMTNAPKRAAPSFYFMLLSSAKSKCHFYFLIIFINQRSTRQNMAAGWTEKISRSTRGKLQYIVFALLQSSNYCKMLWYWVVCLWVIVSPLCWCCLMYHVMDAVQQSHSLITALLFYLQI